MKLLIEQGAKGDSGWCCCARSDAPSRIVSRRMSFNEAKREHMERMQDGYTLASTMGKDLGAIKRLSSTRFVTPGSFYPERRLPYR